MKRLLYNALLLTLYGLIAYAGWTPDPWNGMVTVTNQPGEDWAPKIIRLGTGGYLITWYNLDLGKGMYQVLDEYGNPSLGSTGSLILPAATWLYGGTTYLLADGMGGVIAVFRDLRLGNETACICGQRFDQWGQPLWGTTGMSLVVWNGHDTPLADAAYDGADGFFIAWGLNAGLNNADLYAQKFTKDGSVQWGPYGVPVSIASQNQSYPQIVCDGLGGMVAVWESGIDVSYYLWTQHLNANGNSLLTFNGVPLQLGCGGLTDGVPDGEEGGVFVYTTGGSYWNNLKDIRVNGRGQLLWVWDSGIQALHYITEVQKNPVDGTVWIEANDNRTGGFASYLYHLDLNGNPLFDPQGIPGGECMAPTNNGVITFKTFPTSSNGTKVLAKRVTNEGTQIWESIVALCELPWGTTSLNPISSTSDGNDGSTVALLDRRTQLQLPYDLSNIAAQRVRANGEIGNPLPPRYFLPGGEVQGGRGIQSLPGNQIRLTLNKSGNVALELYDILGRKAAMLLDSYKDAGTYSFTLDLPELSTGMYLLRSTTPDGVQTIKIPITR